MAGEDPFESPEAPATIDVLLVVDGSAGPDDTDVVIVLASKSDDVEVSSAASVIDGSVDPDDTNDGDAGSVVAVIDESAGPEDTDDVNDGSATSGIEEGVCSVGSEIDTGGSNVTTVRVCEVSVHGHEWPDSEHHEGGGMAPRPWTVMSWPCTIVPATTSSNTLVESIVQSKLHQREESEEKTKENACDKVVRSAASTAYLRGALTVPYLWYHIVLILPEVVSVSGADNA
jgi:hypothetical protein